MQITAEQVYAIVETVGATGPAADIAVAGASVESEFKTDARGDYEPGYGYHSYGLWQMHDRGLGYGMSAAARMDPAQAAAVMVPQYLLNFNQAPGPEDSEDRAAWTYIHTERPAGYPNIWSPAAVRFRDKWRELDKTLPQPEVYTPAELEYNPHFPPVIQEDDFSCSAASLAWCVGSIGSSLGYHEVRDAMQQEGILTSWNGLEDGSGAQLARFLRTYWGIEAESYPSVNWAWVYANAGDGPLMIGAGRPWYHWVGVRYQEGLAVSLANPAPNYNPVSPRQPIGQQLTEDWFWRLGSFAAIKIRVEKEDDVARVEELNVLLSVLKDAGRVARENLESALAVEGIPDDARNALEFGALPAVQTIERGGEPA